MAILYWTIYLNLPKIRTVGRIIFEDKKFRGFRGCLVNLENKYPRNFLYIRLDFFLQHVVKNSKWLYIEVLQTSVILLITSYVLAIVAWVSFF